VKRCAFCDGRLGLISHRQGKLRFCKKAHGRAYDLQQWQEREARWFTFIDRWCSLPAGRRERSDAAPRLAGTI
jgi:hypothetical protein